VIPADNLFQSADDIGKHMMAASRSETKTFAVDFLSLGVLEFDQTRDPQDYAIERKSSFFKLTTDPFNRKNKLVVYGFDLFDACMYRDKGILCLSIILTWNNRSTGLVLWKLGRTRCNRPRIHGFLYSLKDKW